MTVREDRDVDGPPAMALAALATAGENLGYAVRDVRTEDRALLMSRGPTLKGASLGFLITARARPHRSGSRLSVDVTPILGSWAMGSAQEELDDLVREFQAVVSAPKARIRRPEKTSPGPRPFGYQPVLWSFGWGLLSLLVYGVLVGGWFWIPAGAGSLGALMALQPRTERWWNWIVTGLAIGSIPFGALGAVGRRLALTNHLWEEMGRP